MFVLDTDHISLFQRHDAYVTARVLATFLYFRTITVLGFNDQAQAMFNRLRSQRLRLGTQDLRIAAVTLVLGATLVSRNQRDFATIPSLPIEDWSVPESDPS